MKYFLKLAITAIGSTLAISSTSAEAATFVYTFSGLGGDLEVTSLDVSPSEGSGSDITVTGFNDLSDAIPGNLNRTGNGLGVDGRPPFLLNSGNVGRGGFGPLNKNEALEFQFPNDEEYTLVSVTFAGLPSLRGSRDVTLAVDGGAESSTQIPGILNSNTVNYGVSGNTFLFNPTDNGDNFRIASAVFDDDLTVPGEVIPEPLTILGTGLALISMPLMKKAHKKA
ncbi:PEP-CTERM sorting domain-containing protein [Gloeocapsa sp. PCC 73106]|uniref:PEP-CTERM sorting domain-containing protein n=1 Tax=Gloeocapsa sp. PCC 73106 TaxID=102232 RepID=UPI0002ACA7D9|nr:PEP-CTERM sorting domain-containing protein [Gloeocapsa sp. PCC 73106]ELS00253.1 hypothetical protein GLO73106DRAFT_00041100 [Gloeocapsa sp. PCC 73106]